MITTIMMIMIVAVLVSMFGHGARISHSPGITSE
jgi:hypothetical protein